MNKEEIITAMEILEGERRYHMEIIDAIREHLNKLAIELRRCEGEQ